MIEYRGYTIEPADSGPRLCGFNYEFTHKEYDGTEDHRYGVAKTVEDAMLEIDMLEDDE